MNPAEYRDALSRLDLTQTKAARFFGVSEATARSWGAQHGEAPPQAVAMMLRLMVKLRWPPDAIDRILDT